MKCFRCHKTPDEIPEYADEVEEFGTADDYVIAEEGTYNSLTSTFCCTPCYIAIGMPSSPNGWKAPSLTEINRASNDER